MIHYHGGPITPETVAVTIWRGSHAFISFVYPGQLQLAMELCQSFALDNGAFSAWKNGETIDWEKYYTWVDGIKRHPGFDFAIIPDAVQGDEQENDRLIEMWPHGHAGAPVWHLGEPIERLQRLCREWPRVALGSSGDYSTPNSGPWWDRMATALNAICDENGFPPSKLHGLRMLNPDVFTKIPFTSADSTNVARNVGIDKRWIGNYGPLSKEVRGRILKERIEAYNSATKWNRQAVQLLLT